MTNKEIQEKVIHTLAVIFDMQTAKISPETNARSLARWDSLNQIKLTVALEEEFDLEFEPEEIAAMTSVKAIVDVISAKMNN